MEWRPIKDFPNYEISEDGVIRQISNGQILPQYNGRAGYKISSLLRNRKRHTARINRFVAKAFHGDPPTPEHHAAHNDGNKLNNHYTNLRWATPYENYLDSVKHGTYPFTKNSFREKYLQNLLRGEAAPSAKLTEQNVLQIRHLYSSGATKSELSKTFSVTAVNIHRIVKRETWKHI